MVKAGEDEKMTPKTPDFSNISKIVGKRTFRKKKHAKRQISKKKPILKSVAKLKKELWTVFSLFIRKRDNFTCFTCGHKGTGGAIHGGHYITGATCKLPLFFDERNVHAQCYACNILYHGNWRVYQAKMHQKYGPEIDDEFDRLNQWNGSGRDFPFEEKIVYYKSLSTDLVAPLAP